MAKICVVDYKGGNIFSVQNTLKHLGADCFLSSDPKEVNKADKILFPGVGSFGASMHHIKELGLAEVLRNKALSGIPFLGVCVGMQVLFRYGTELYGNQEIVEGLGVFEGTVDKFEEKDKLKIPHMGWNQIHKTNSNPLFKGLDDNSNFYFVHSYMVKADEKIIESNEIKFPRAKFICTDYGIKFISSIWDGSNLFACQFHPEKSGENGLQVIKNFINL